MDGRKAKVTKYNDTLGRRIQTDIGSVVNAHYVYKNGSGGENAATTLVSTLVYPDRQYHFTYGESRAILSVKRVQGSDAKTTAYAYDESGSPVGFMFHGQNYYFEKTLQGDISRIYDSEGNVVGEYLYDAWGNLLNADSLTEIAKQNPVRYRGYYFDSETGFYYVSSRYYDPEIGRFLNADDTEYLGADGSVLSYNLFAYCMNDPVNRFDVDGNWSLPNWAKVVVGAVATVAAVAVTVATGGAAAPVLIGVAVSTIGGAASGAIQHRVTTGTWKGADKAALDGAADGFMTGAISGAITGGVGRATQVLRNTSVAGKLGKTGKPLSSQSIVKNGEVTNTRFYNIKGKATFQLDYTNHGFPKYHSIPHGHKINFSDPKPWSNPINNLWRSRW